MSGVHARLRPVRAVLLFAACSMVWLGLQSGTAGALAKNRAPGRVSGTHVTPHGTLVTGPGATALGFCGGDDWEPDIATDPTGTYVYAIIAHYPGDPTCDPASGNQNR